MVSCLTLYAPPVPVASPWLYQGWRVLVLLLSDIGGTKSRSVEAVGRRTRFVDGAWSCSSIPLIPPPHLSKLTHFRGPLSSVCLSCTRSRGRACRRRHRRQGIPYACCLLASLQGAHTTRVMLSRVARAWRGLEASPPNLFPAFACSEVEDDFTRKYPPAAWTGNARFVELGAGST